MLKAIFQVTLFNNGPDAMLAKFLATGHRIKGSLLVLSLEDRNVT
jgi:hypothetical protein